MRFPISLCLVLLACDPSTAPTPTAPTVTAVATDTPPEPKKDAGSSPFGDAKLCGCALCDPVVSNDACKTDDDCAPATACHATACVAKAKAEPRKADQMCTQDLRCDSIDANACGCVNGKCALYPRKK